jgi:putative hydrolase of the HAD superfamily
MPIKAVFFDLDNTLYHQSSQLQEAINSRILRYLERTLGLDAAAAYTLRQHYFYTYGTTMRGLQLHHGVTIEPYLAFVHDLPFEELIQPDPVLEQQLHIIHGHKVIFTNSPVEHAHAVLRRLGITAHFGHIIDIRFLQFVPKPAISGYERALALLAVAGNESVMVEDTAANLVPARELGMTTILIADHTPVADHAADYIVPDVYSAIRVIAELQSQ